MRDVAIVVQGAAAGMQDLLAPAVLLPSQFADMRAPEVPPVRRLLVAVLEDAVRTYQRGLSLSGEYADRAVRETEAWFASDEIDSPFTFVAICAALDLDPDHLRAGLRRWATRLGEDRAARQRSPLRVRRVAGDRHLVTPPRRLALGTR